MAELKEHEAFSMDYVEPLEIPTTPIEETISKNPAPLPEVQKKPWKISRWEKILVASLLVVMIALAFVSINLNNELTMIQEKIKVTETTIQKSEGNITQLQQEKTELSSAERIKKIAEKYGLKSIEDNVRNVK